MEEKFIRQVKDAYNALRKQMKGIAPDIFIRQLIALFL